MCRSQSYNSTEPMDLKAALVRTNIFSTFCTTTGAVRRCLNWFRNVIMISGMPGPRPICPCDGRDVIRRFTPKAAKSQCNISKAYRLRTIFQCIKHMRRLTNVFQHVVIKDCVVLNWCLESHQPDSTTLPDHTPKFADSSND